MGSTLLNMERVKWVLLISWWEISLVIVISMVNGGLEMAHTYQFPVIEVWHMMRGPA